VSFPSRDGEDSLLRAVWNQRDHAGWWLFEVPLGYPIGTPPPVSARRLDALVLPESAARLSDAKQDLVELDTAIEGQPVELIEAKWDLNTSVIGQLLCGTSMFTAQYPTHGPIKLTAVVVRANDAALRWFCDVEGIEVIQVEQATAPS
jgi:hypothetical protein